MKITSTAMDGDCNIDSKYTCEGDNVSPPLTFSDVPPETKSLALIMDDPDAPNGTFTHWVLYDMDPNTAELAENTPPASGKSGLSGYGKTGYGGPCPPSGTHHYHFKLYALDAETGLAEGASKSEVESAMEGHVISGVETVGLYAKKNAA